MKKIFMLAAAAATLFAVSCNRAQGPEALIEEENDNSPVAVKFTTNVATVSGITKAAVDDFTGAESLYIYGLGVDKDGEPLADILIDNVAAYSPGTAIDPTDAGAINVWDPNFAESVPFFYGTSNEVYSFYGYYVGDALADPEPEVLTDNGKKSATLDVEFDGTQDIMIATTDKNADYDAAGASFRPDQVYSAKSARKGVEPNLVFKHQLARFEFHLKFKQLPESTLPENMTLKGITIESPTNAVKLHLFDQNLAPWVTSEDPEVEIPFEQKAEFIPTNEPSVFALHNFDGTVFGTTTSHPDVLPDDPDYGTYSVKMLADDNYHQAGESIMVAPDASIYPMTLAFSYTYTPVLGTQPVYEMQPVLDPETGDPVLDPETGEPVMEPVLDPETGEPVVIGEEPVYGTPVDICYDGEAGNYEPFKWDINLTELLPDRVDPETGIYEAEAGKKYVVQLIVYGPAQIEVNVTLEDWEEVVLPEIDPDAE